MQILQHPGPRVWKQASPTIQPQAQQQPQQQLQAQQQPQPQAPVQEVPIITHIQQPVVQPSPSRVANLVGAGVSTQVRVCVVASVLFAESIGAYYAFS